MIRYLLRRIFFPGVRFGEPPRDRTYGDSIRALLTKRYPPWFTQESGQITSTRHLPLLPRGALSRIADEVGCSRAYVGQIAREAGYTVERAA